MSRYKTVMVYFYGKHIYEENLKHTLIFISRDIYCLVNTKIVCISLFYFQKLFDINYLTALKTKTFFVKLILICELNIIEKYFYIDIWLTLI